MPYSPYRWTQGKATADHSSGLGVCRLRSRALAGRQVVGLPPRGLTVYRRAHAATAGEGFDCGGRAASPDIAQHACIQSQVDVGQRRGPVQHEGEPVEAPHFSGDGTPERLPFVGEDGLMPVVSSPQADRAARPCGTYAVTPTPTSGASRPRLPARPQTSPPAPAISSTRRDAHADLAPDGRHMTFVSSRSGEDEIWRADGSGTEAVQLTFMGANPGWPRWSPSGDQIAFHSNPEGNGDIILVPAEGGKPRQSHVASGHGCVSDLLA